MSFDFSGSTSTKSNKRIFPATKNVKAKNADVVSLDALSGVPIKDNEKVVNTLSHQIKLSDTFGGASYPVLSMKRLEIKDFSKKNVILENVADELAKITDFTSLKFFLDTVEQSQIDYLNPSRDELQKSVENVDKSMSQYMLNNIRGQRTEQFFDEVMQLLPMMPLSDSDSKRARMEINKRHRAAYLEHNTHFDDSDTETYWSYGHDAAFVHVYEKMLENLSPTDPKRKGIQNELDYVFSHKYTPDGKVDEGNIEQSLGLMAIDKDSRELVSITEESKNAVVPRYETLQIPSDIASEHAGKSVYREGDFYFLEGGSTLLPVDLEMQLIRTPVSEVVFRRRGLKENLRHNFKFDWNGNRRVDVEEINTGWWGHCDIKAIIETVLADMSGSAGVTEYRSESDQEVHYSKADQLEALASLLEIGSRYASIAGQGDVNLGQTEFAGSRYNDEATQVNILTNLGHNIPISIKYLSDLFDVEEINEGFTIEEMFSFNKVAEDGHSFSENPLLLRTESGDVNYIDASKLEITGAIEKYSFDVDGQVKKSRDGLVLYSSAVEGNEELCILSSNITNYQTRTVQEIAINQETGELFKTDIVFELNPVSGEYEERRSDPVSLGFKESVELGHEMKSGDDAKEKFEILLNAVKSGDKIATDRETAMQVWNGEVHRIEFKIEWSSDDGLWERVFVEVDSAFGTADRGTFLNHYNEAGVLLESHELDAAVDFYWQDRPKIAPLIAERGNWFLNRKMWERGLIDPSNNEDFMGSIELFKDLNDLIYLGLKNKEQAEVYTIVHEGKRLVYNEKEAWMSDVRKLKGLDSDKVSTADVS